MGKAIRARGIPPKRFQTKFSVDITDPQWTDAYTIEWIKTVAEGTVWYDPMRFETVRGHFSHIELDVWFSKKQDAMFYKLEFMI